MTLLNMLEVVRQQFPDKLNTQVRIDLNLALQLFSEETRLPFDDFDVTVADDNSLGIGTVPLVETKGWYALPSTVKDVVRVQALDSKFSEMTVLDYHVEHVGRRFVILDLNNMIYQGLGFPAGITTLRFGCTVTPLALSVDADAPTYPESFHQAIVDHVFAKYFGYKGVLQSSGWYKSAYQAQVAAAKRYFNRHIQ